MGSQEPPGSYLPHQPSYRVPGLSVQESLRASFTLPYPAPPPPYPGQPPFYDYEPFFSDLRYPATFEGRRTWDEIKGACLHRCYKEGRISWKRCLGHGVNGVVYKATIGGEGPFAIKIFWHSRPPRPQFVSGSRRWSFATECRNTATLDILKHTVESTSDPIKLGAAPETVRDAKVNMYCFSKEAETKALEFKKATSCPPFPPTMTRWHGWTRIKSLDLPDSFHKYRDIQKTPDYEDLGFQYAIVYEYVRKLPEQDISAAQTQIDFLYTAGFLLYQLRVENWNQGRLVDVGDLFRPVDRLDPRLRTRRWDASVVFAARCLDVKALTAKRKGEQDEERDGSKRMRSDYAGSAEDENEVIGRKKAIGGQETRKMDLTRMTLREH